MDNNFRIKPGENLTPKELIDRYLDWSAFNEWNHRDAQGDGCQEKLWHSHLCCTDHMAYSAEFQTFMAYFKLLFFVRGLSDKSIMTPMIMKKILQDNKVMIDTAKVARHFGYTVDEWIDMVIDEKYFSRFIFFNDDDYDELTARRAADPIRSHEIVHLSLR